MEYTSDFFAFVLLAVDRCKPAENKCEDQPRGSDTFLHNSHPALRKDAVLLGVQFIIRIRGEHKRLNFGCQTGELTAAIGVVVEATGRIAGPSLRCTRITFTQGGHQPIHSPAPK